MFLDNYITIWNTTTAINFRTGASIAAALLLSGCVMGPDFSSPDAPGASGYTNDRLTTAPGAPGVAGGETQQFVLGKEVDGKWWTLFKSPQINAFVDEAILKHPDIQAAQYALRAARENVLAEGGALYPQLSISDSATRERSAASSSGPASVFNLYNSSVSVSYALDLFGGTRRELESKEAAVEYQQFQLEATYLALTANVVNAALTDASLRAQIRATQDIITLQRDQLTRIQQQFELGAVPNSDVLSQQSTLAQTEASLPALQKQLAQQRNALMTYLGRLPNEDRGESVSLASLQLPKSIPVSLPSSLVRQRPDIRAAEASLHEATAEVGVSVASMLPQISLSGSYSGAATRVGNVFSADSIAWSVASSVTQKLFDGGAAYHQKEATVAQFEQSLARYKSTVNTAFQDVANSLRAIQYDARTLQAQLAAEQSAHNSLVMAEEQYKTGAVSYPNVLTAQQTYQNAVVSRVKSQALRFTDTVALFQSLGGGWWNRDDQDDKSQPRKNPGYFSGPDSALAPAKIAQTKKD